MKDFQEYFKKDLRKVDRFNKVTETLLTLPCLFSEELIVGHFVNLVDFLKRFENGLGWLKGIGRSVGKDEGHSEIQKFDIFIQLEIDYRVR